MTKQWKCYAKKPKRIRNAKDLLKFFKAIPAKLWCVDALETCNGKKRCAMGHLNAAYGRSAYDWDAWPREGYGFRNIDGFNSTEIVYANNGDRTIEDRAKTPGKIKSRVVNFIKANIDR